MPKLNRIPIEPTHDWKILQTRFTWPEQRLYEFIRPVVLFGETPAQRAQETGMPERTIYRKAERFDAQGLLGLLVSEEPNPDEDRRNLPRDIRQVIIDLVVQYPAFHAREIAVICETRFDRRPSPHTIKRVLAERDPAPSRLDRRYPPFHAMADPSARRFAVVQLHSEGWSVKAIAGYLETTRATVYAILERWVTEKVLTEHSRAPKKQVRKVDLATMHTVRKLQENPELGAFRMKAALQQLGIRLSERTCGRILAQNRKLYGMAGPDPQPRKPKVQPFKAEHRHQYWTVDVRYIEDHQLGAKPFYVIAILENFSRAILASAISPTQDLMAYLIVLYAAIRQHGVPEALVSDGGAIFKANQAQAIYQRLGIRKERIDKRQAWQSYIETQFNVQRRMADYHFAKATTWEGLQAVHDKWVADFNYQIHWAHRDRQDGRHSPAEVLGWVRGQIRDAAELHRIFYTVRFQRRLNGAGYLHFRHWRVYGERGLARKVVGLWLYEENLTLEFSDEPLAQYAVKYQPDHKHFTEIHNVRLLDTQYRSPQLMLWQPGEVEWHLVQRDPESIPRRRPRVTAVQLPLFELENTGS
jgi:putative transposase